MLSKLKSHSAKESWINHWVEINEAASYFKLMGLILGITNLGLIGICLLLYFKSPIVALLKEDDVFYLAGQKRKVTLGKGTIERHIRRFIKGHYEWGKLEEKRIARDIKSLVTKGLYQKVLTDLEKLKGQFKGKLSQKITSVEVKITAKEAWAKFDRVLRVNEIPLVIPTEISFGFIQGVKHKFNPSGLEINSLKVHENS